MGFLALKMGRDNILVLAGFGDSAQLKGSVSGGSNGGSVVEVTHVRGALPALSRGRCHPGLQVRHLRPREPRYLA